MADPKTLLPTGLGAPSVSPYDRIHRYSSTSAPIISPYTAAARVPALVIRGCPSAIGGFYQSTSLMRSVAKISDDCGCRMLSEDRRTASMRACAFSSAWPIHATMPRLHSAYLHWTPHAPLRCDRDVVESPRTSPRSRPPARLRDRHANDL